jgi:hypothetical protein
MNKKGINLSESESEQLATFDDKRKSMTHNEAFNEKGEFDPKLIDYDKYTRFDCPLVTVELYPKDLSKYPKVVSGDKERAIIAINPKRGFIVHRDGAKSELGDVQKMDIEAKLPAGGYKWTKIWLDEHYKKGVFT